MSGCVEVEGDEGDDSDDDDSGEETEYGHLAQGESQWRWVLNPRVPLAAPGLRPKARVQYGDLYLPAQPENGYWQGTIEGGPYEGPAPLLELLPHDEGAKEESEEANEAL
jgi:hypothetical protein